MLNAKKMVKFLPLLLPPIFILAVTVMADAIIDLAESFIPICHKYQNHGLSCPGCGNRRSVYAMLRGDILTSIRYNITILFFLLLGGAFYIEYIFYLCGKKIIIVPRKEWLIYVFLGLFVLYFLLRNFIPI